MSHLLPPDDQQLRADFAACRVPPGEFDHGAHIRLACTCLAEHDTETALALVRSVLLAFIQHNQIHRQQPDPAGLPNQADALFHRGAVLAGGASAGREAEPRCHPAPRWVRR
jgi:hypothetical protein